MRAWILRKRIALTEHAIKTHFDVPVDRRCGEWYEDVQYLQEKLSLLRIRLIRAKR